MSSVDSISGGAAGSITGELDVQWIVEQIIYAKQAPIRDLETFEVFYEAKKEAFQELNTRVSAVESALYTLNESGFAGKTATQSSDDFFTTTVSTTASNGNYSIKVKQLAQAESYTSDIAIDDPTKTTIFNNGDTFVITPRDGSGAETIDVTGKSLNDLKNSINSLGLDVTASVIQYDTDDYRLVVTADETGLDEGFTISGNAATTTLSMDQKIANQDAQIYVNNFTDPISRSSNTFSDVIEGVTFNLTDADDSTIVTIAIEEDSSNLKENIQTFVDAFNDAMDYLNSQFEYDEENERAGVLSGESAAVKVKNDLLTLATSTVSGHDGSNSYRSFALIGLEMNRTGHLELNESDLDKAINTDLEAVKRVFKDGGSVSSGELAYIGSSDDTKGGTYTVHVDQVATLAQTAAGNAIAANLGQDETLTITYNGNNYTVNLDSGDSSDSVVTKINTAMGDKNVPVYAQIDGSGNLEFIADNYGSNTIEVVSNVAAAGGGTGIGTTAITGSGVDVIGEFRDSEGNTYAATGNGRLLTGSTGSTKGLIVSVSATTLSDPVNGDDKGTVYVTKGVGETLRERMYEISFPYTGIIAKNIESLEDKLQNISDKIAAINYGLESEQEILIAQFTKANEAMAQMEYLKSTLSSS
jgi:flagellar hook-associated protein 2